MSGEATLRGNETFTPPPVTVRVAPMLRIQGYSDLSRVRPVIKDVAQRMASVAEQSFNPAVRYRHLKVLSCVEGTLALETGTDLHCPAFAHFLPECREVVVFVLTIGRDFDRRLEDLLQRGKTLEALFLESAGVARSGDSHQEADRALAADIDPEGPPPHEENRTGLHVSGW